MTDLGNFLPGSDLVVGDDGDGVNEVVGRVPSFGTRPTDLREELEAAFSLTSEGHPASFGQKQEVVEKVEGLVKKWLEI